MDPGLGLPKQAKGAKRQIADIGIQRRRRDEPLDFLERAPVRVMIVLMRVIVRVRMIVVMVIVRVFRSEDDVLVLARLRGDHVHFRRADPAAIYLSHFNTSFHAERIDGAPEKLNLHPGMDERAQHHVATDSGEAIEVGDAHQCPPVETNWLSGKTEFMEPER